jgi:hypothetical protein
MIALGMNGRIIKTTAVVAALMITMVLHLTWYVSEK